MRPTKEQVEKLRKDPFARHMASLMGLDLDELINDYNKDLEKEEKKPIMKNIVSELLDDMVKEGKIKCVEKNGQKHYFAADEEILSEKKKCEKPTVEHTFLMSKEQLENFVNKYRALIEARKKVEYLFGIKFEDGGAGFDFTSKINEIIWDFVRVIFGDENTEDIVDYVFGNSNFDDVKSLYDELVYFQFYGV